MNLLDTILNTQGGAIVKQIGSQFGLNESQVKSAIGVLGPILAGALAQNMKRSGGLDSLLGALKGGNHSQYIDNSSVLGQPGTIKDGNGILEHLLGDKAVSREAASRAAPQTGIGSDLIKKMLPILASVVMGGLSKNARSDGLLDALSPDRSQSDGLMSILQPMLDQNQDGSALDDILSMATRYLR